MAPLEQVGLHPNAAVALRVAWREAGLPGLFRGTTSLLAREVRRDFDACIALHPLLLGTCTYAPAVNCDIIEKSVVQADCIAVEWLSWIMSVPEIMCM